MDYREAADKLADSEQMAEEGGSYGFDNVEMYIERMAISYHYHLFPKYDDYILILHTKQEVRIIKAIETGYSQHMIAKVLDISQPAVREVVKKGRK